MKIPNNIRFPVFVLLLGLLIRLTFVFLYHQPEKFLFSDMQGYFDRAMELKFEKADEIFYSFYPPAAHVAYSVMMGSRDVFFWIKLYNVFLSISTCILIYLITLRLFGRLAGYISVVIASFNYLFIEFTGYVISEILFMFLLALMFYFFLLSITAKKQVLRWLFSFLAGLSLMSAAATKSSILLFVIFFGLWWLLNFRKYKIFSNLFFYIVGFLPLFIILAIRLHSLTGEYGVVSTNGGFNFFQGRSHIRDVTFRDTINRTEFFFASPMSDLNNYTYNDTFNVGPYDSKFFYKKGWEIAKQNIPLTIKYSLKHCSDLFTSARMWPSYVLDKQWQILGLIGNVAFVILIIVPAFFIVFIHFKTLYKGLGIIVTFPILVIMLVSMFFYGDPRFRIPYDVFFIILAGYYYSEIYNLFVNWRNKSKV